MMKLEGKNGYLYRRRKLCQMFNEIQMAHAVFEEVMIPRNI